MSSSSSTAPAESPRHGTGSGSRSRPRTVITWALLATWAVLIAFGVVAMGDPAWLEDLARKGRQTEAGAYQHLGDNELRKGNNALAIAQYVHALSIRPDQPAVLLNLSLAYLRQGDVVRGEAALLQASRLETTARERSYISLHLGEAAERQGRPLEAIRLYEQALQEGGRRDLVCRKLGAVHLAQKDLARAEAAFAQTLAAQLDPLLPYLKLLERTQEAAQQDSLARRWLEADTNQSLSEADWQRYDRESIAVMLARDPEIAKTHNHLGLLAHLRGEHEDAVRHFEQSLALWPNNPDAARNLRILRASGGAIVDEAGAPAASGNL